MSTGLQVFSDLSSIGGPAYTGFNDGGFGGDVTPGDLVFSYEVTVSQDAVPGLMGLSATISDAQSRAGSAMMSLTVEAPPPVIGDANPAFWVTDGAVYDIVPVGSAIFIGGRFTQVGPCTGCGVPVDASSGTPAGPFPRVNGLIEAVVSDGSGGWYIGGQFTMVGSALRSNIARILPDGSVSSWNPGANGQIQALALDGPILYCGPSH